ncbi:unnamed protein product [marine sediment metagenome]|uniref:Uncharacterized protein n=1 Tax=marine sediment metagenome TaxID=412755 RepID=X1FP82_9ZZZZ
MGNKDTSSIKKCRERVLHLVIDIALEEGITIYETIAGIKNILNEEE